MAIWLLLLKPDDLSTKQLQHLSSSSPTPWIAAAVIDLTLKKAAITSKMAALRRGASVLPDHAGVAR
ncbi:MAG: hypothetical protein U5K38_09315 [Woeseiaceae bacterium]|nr:hypothetical protein [Woeseiaceae bacterium]